MNNSALRRVAAIAILATATSIAGGCSAQERALQETSPSDFAASTPAAAASYGAETHRIAIGGKASIAEASNNAGTFSYENLELSVVDASLCTYEEFVRSYPRYAEEGWSDRGDKFLEIRIEVSNNSSEPASFAVEDLTVYSDSIRLYDDSGPYWTPVLDFALAERYGSIETRVNDRGGSWGYPDGWNEIDGGSTRQFSVPFRLYPKDMLGEDIAAVRLDDLYLQVYGARSDADIARGKRPSDCYLFALSEKGSQ